MSKPSGVIIFRGLAATAVALILMGPGCKPTDVVTTDTSPVDPNQPFQAAGVGADQQAWFLGAPTLSFNHVQPGVRSEFYVDLAAPPIPPIDFLKEGKTSPIIDITLIGPGVMGEKTQTKPYESGKKTRFIWSINRFGQYETDVTARYDGRTIYDGKYFEVVK